MPDWKLAFRQGLAYKGPLLAVGTTVLVAIIILAATPLYFTALQDLGLRHGLVVEDRSAFHIQVVLPLTPLDPAANAQARGAVEDVAEGALGWLTTERRVYTQSRSLLVSRPGQVPPPGPLAPLGFIQSLPQVEEHTSLVSGRFPEPGVTLVNGVPQVESLVGALGARYYQVEPGDVLVLNEGRSQDRRRLRVYVSGVGIPTDPAEEYWMGSSETFLGTATLENVEEELQQIGEDLPPTGFFALEGTLLEAMSTAFPGQPGSSLAFLYTDLNQITAENIDRVQESLKRLSVDLTNAVPRALTLTRLDTALERFERRLFFSRIPLLLLIVLVEVAVLYALVMVANLLIDAQRGGMALVASRGANPLQVLMVYGAQGTFLAAVGLALGPPLAAGGVALLGLTPPFAAVTGGAFLPFKLLPAAYLWSLGGAAFCVGLLVALALRGASFSVVQQRIQRGRPTPLALVQLYYLDVGMVLIATLFLWDLNQQQSLLSRTALGGLTVDQTLLVTPVIFLGAVALLLLRLFPLFLRLSGWAASYLLPAWAGLGLWQMGRRPAFANQLLLLVVLVVALGWFGATFGATLERSARERALYQTAVDFTISRPRSFPVREVDDLEPYFSRVQGVKSVTTAYQGTVGLGTAGGDYQLLAVDPRSAANLFWFREDFSEATLTDLMVSLGGATEEIAGAREIPPDAEALGLWVKPDASYGTVFLWAVFRDAAGAYLRVTFGEMDFDEWRYVEVPLRTPGGTLRLVPPASLEAIEVYQPTLRQGTPGRILLDGFQVVTSTSPEPLLLEGFENLAGWTPIVTSPSRDDSLQSNTRDVKEGGRSVAFRFGRDTIDGVRGFYLNRLNGPMPIHASPDFLAGAGVGPGDEVTLSVEGVLVPAIVRETVHYFPTLDPRRRFVLAPIEPLLDYLNLVKSGAPIRPNEILLDLPKEPARRAEARAALEELGLLGGSQVVDRQEVLAELALDPLAMAGWRGLVIASLAVLLLLVVVGYFSYSLLLARDRRQEVGISRALGLGRSDIFRGVVLEHGLVLAVGVAVGSWAGLQLSSMMIPLLTVTEEGQRFLPPFLIETSWEALLILLGGLLLGVVATVLLIGKLWTSVAASQALRAGEA